MARCVRGLLAPESEMVMFMTTKSERQKTEITAATLIKDCAECLASVPALIQQANAKNLRRAASFIRAGITRQMIIAQLCMREAQRLEQMETSGD
ncbi:Uncharacterised protein [Escherichia coli]|nr:Uncharacterised protein [Escherichia coli]